MLPLGHVAYTWSVLSLLQTHDYASQADYRGMVFAALLPDMIDKPLSLTVMSDSGTSQGLSHTLLAHAVVTLATACFRPHWLPYALAFNGHLIADQMWKYTDTLLFPFSGRLDSWQYMGSPGAMLSAYAEIATRPGILAVEAVGLALMSWFVKKHKLNRRRPMVRLMLTGQVDHESADAAHPRLVTPDAGHSYSCGHG
ncbi:metal-dependent hydrolase [Chloroflexota bacterium]